MPVPIPGVKLGLANVIVIIMLYFMDAKSAFFVSLIRVLLSGLLFAGFAGMLYSMAGALCSFAVMVLLQKTGKFSMIGVSVAGGIFHNIGQIVVAIACGAECADGILFALPARFGRGNGGADWDCGTDGVKAFKSETTFLTWLDRGINRRDISRTLSK